MEPQIFGFVPYLELLCMSENGEVLAYRTFVRAVMYDPKVDRLEYPNIQSDKVWYAQFLYIESLVSPCFVKFVQLAYREFLLKQSLFFP